MTEQVRGLYFEEFLPDQEYISPGRTITETDIVNFAALSGDWTQIHTDAEFAKTTPFGQRIAHGLLGLSVATGLGARMGFIEGTAIAFMAMSEWKFTKPVLIGDTIRLKVKLNKKRAMSPEAGVVYFDVAILNQRDEVTQKGQWTVLVKRRV
jgi:3-hydroxybutyryl-CoA dehydratase